MRRFILQLTLVLLVATFSQTAMATNYYFSQISGNDSRSATEAQNPNTPWKSIAKLNSIFNTLKPGDVVYFKRGEVFYGTIQVTKSGAAGNPIVFDAYGTGAKPIITSFVSLKNWQSKGNGIYESSDAALSSSKVNMVLLNGINQEMGRYPNSNDKNKGYLNIDATQGNTAVTSNSLTSSPNWKGGEVVIRKNYWITDRHTITSHSGGKIAYATAGSSYSPAKDYGFFIQNHIGTLDVLGEWFYNPSSKKLAVYFGSKNPSSVEVKVSTLDYLVNKPSYSINFISFKNLQFEGANKDVFHIKGGKDIQIQHCEIKFSGENALFAEGASNFKLEDSKISNSNNNGIKFLHSTHGSIFKNNVIENTYLFPGMGMSGDGNGMGIFAPGDNTLIEYNQILNTGYSGIHFGGNNTVVQYNFVNYFCLTKNDGGGIYTYTGSSNKTLHNRKVVSNIILNGIGVREGAKLSSPMSKPQSEGIYLDDNTTGVEVRNNTIANITSKGIYVHNARENRIVQNLVYNSNVQLSFVSDHLGADIRNNVIEGNVFFSKSAEQINLSFSTPKNDIPQMGTFDKNIYSNPLSDNFRIIKKYLVQTAKEVNKSLDLSAWQKLLGTDKNSKVQPINIPAFQIEGVIGQNKFDNKGFDKHANYITVNGGSSSWEKNSELDGGALKIKGSGSFEATFNVGKVEGGKNYVLKFSAKGNKSFAPKSYLRQRGAPWQPVSADHAVEINNKRNEYEVVIQPVVTAEATSLVMKFEDIASAEMAVDNFEFYEVKGTVTNPDDKILFEINPSKTVKTVNLDGIYVCPNNMPYYGKITLEPFSSVILIRISDPVPAVEEENLPPTVKIVSPKHNAAYDGPQEIEIRVEAKGKGCDIKKVEFFSGDKLLGTANSAPYVYSGKNIQAGKYTITAKATDINSRVTVSEAVVVKVEGSVELVEEKSNDGGFELYLNAGTDKDVTLNGKVFKGDKNLKYHGSSYENSSLSASKDELFQTERNGPVLKYTIPVPNGTYTVTTYHNELWWGQSGRAGGKGSRVFDISLEGKLVKDDFDIYIEGQNKETTLTFQNIEVKDGKLNLDMISSRDRASISGIAIVGVAAAAPAKPIESVKPAQPAFELYLNAGTATDVTMDGKVFKGDKNLKNYGSSYENSNVSASKDELYQTERNGPALKYTIAVPNGTYTVKTYHNELWWGLSGRAGGKGRRVFDISIEGKLLKDDFDIYVESKNKQTVLTFKNIEVKDGKLNLDMISSMDRASVSGIAIVGSVAAEPAKPVQPAFELYLNAGTAKDVKLNGKIFKGDKNLKNYGSSYENSNPSASKDELFQTERNGPVLKYTIPVPNGTYTVTTYHNELWWGLSGRAGGKGRRIFDISIEGKLVKDDFDIYVESKNKQTVLTFQNVEVKDGKLNLDMISSRDRASVSAIEIVGASAQASKTMAQARISEVEETVVIEEAAVEAQVDNSRSVKMYPNPATEVTTVAINQDIALATILIHDMSGQLMQQLDPRLLRNDGANFQIPLNSLSNGIYLISLVGEREVYERLRLIVQ